MRLLFFVLCAFLFCRVQAQVRVPLYSGDIPNSIPSKNREQDFSNISVDTITKFVSEPSLTVFLPDKNKQNGVGVIICPGGGYHLLLTKREGAHIAKAFNKLGVTAFVLRYRIPDERILQDPSIGPLQDVQMAIKLVREHATGWGVDVTKIGVMGFSAGGHVAATAAVHFDHSFVRNEAKTSLRPDFAILINPIISMHTDLTHLGSRKNLLGSTPAVDKIEFYSNELHVDTDTPPVFLVHSTRDSVVSVNNSIVFYQALQKQRVSTEMHLYADGEHGFLTNPSFEEWFGRCTNWLFKLLTD
ncbi:alpha/beta hydrolase [Sphingobacterium tabacisoli]|uniref:Alpha/beta hydrolase n=1 Tax=Sphingobacterium tabacisoli TaxID=2044855 RepID=A0ABW5KXJ2_9SPHI|nr:alpha/beta hydrolase [Sphingobacterium tabacisoli]